MKKLPFLITVAILVLLIGGYFAYQYFRQKPVQAWDLIPTDALLVYEKNDCSECLKEVSETSFWTVVARAASFNESGDSVLRGVNRVLASTNGILVSAHITKKDDFDFIYYIPFSTDFLSASKISSLKGYSLRSRVFNGITINEIRYDQSVFSYASIEGILVGSFTPFLVEDVVRTFSVGGESGKQQTFGSLQFTTIKDDAGNLYVKLQGVQDFLSALTADTKLNYQIGRSTILDVKADANSIILNGFSTDSIDHSKYFLSIFQHQSPVSLGLKHLISNRAISVLSYGVSNGEQLYDDRAKFITSNRPRLKDSLTFIASKYSLDIKNLYSKIADEVAVCYMENTKKDFSRVALIETSDVRPWVKSFESLADKLSVDTVFYERYSQYEIREIPSYKFSEKLMWPLLVGFENNFYTAIGKVILIAEDVEQLKNFIDDIESEETWGRSVAQNKFLETTLLESNVSVYFNAWKFLNFYSSGLQSKWQQFIKENKAMLQSLQMSSIQFSHLNNSYYTNALFTFKPIVNSRGQEKNPNRTSIVFPNGISSLSAVRSHVNRSNEVLIQDSLNDLSLISAEGKVLWKRAIGERIVGEITQVDFFNNGKLQYFFATQFSLHVIDRLGNYVSPFPATHNVADVEHVNVIDYDNSKKYRFLLSGKTGKIYMFDKEGTVLDGWRPNDGAGAFGTSPKHFRIKGKDYVIGIRKDGVVALWTRRGEMIRNFPVNLQAEPIGDVFLERGNTLEETYFVIVSRDGFRIRLNAQGKIHSKETLLKTSIRSIFSMVLEKGGKSYLIVQQDERELTVMDADGRKLLSSPVTGTQPGDVRFYNYGSGKSFISVRDNAQGLYYVYDMQGNLLTTPPIESSMLEIRPLDSDEFMLIFIHDRSLLIQPLS